MQHAPLPPPLMFLLHNSNSKISIAWDSSDKTVILKQLRRTYYTSQEQHEAWDRMRLLYSRDTWLWAVKD